MNRFHYTATTFALIALLGLTLILPIFLAVGSAFLHDGQLSTYWFTRLADHQTLRELTNAVTLATLATAISIFLGVPLAFLRARYSFRGQTFLSIAVLLPLILPPFVGALSMRKLLAQFGVLNLILQKLGLQHVGVGQLPPDWLEGGLLTVAVVQALHLFPIIYLNASAALANVDPAYTQAARNLGAGPIRTFFSVTLPLIKPGLFAGAVIVFIWAFTDIGTPLMMNFRELPAVRIFHELASGDYSGKTYSLVFVLLAVSVTLYIIGKFVLGKPIDVDTAKATTAADQRKLGPAGTLLAWLMFGSVLTLAILPHIGVILTAVSDHWIDTVLPAEYTLHHLKAVIQSDDTYRSITNSLQYAGTSTIFDLLIGSTIAFLVVRAKSKGSTLLDALAMLPLAVPGIVLAAGYVAATAPGTALESIGPSGNPFVILVIAYTVRRLPFVVRGVSAGLQQVPETLEQAARNLGASQRTTAWRITLPLIAASAIAAGVLTFSFAVLEVSDSLILAQRDLDYPITKQIYILFGSSTRNSANLAAALGVYAMVLLGGTMTLASLLLGKKLGTIFRA